MVDEINRNTGIQRALLVNSAGVVITSLPVTLDASASIDIGDVTLLAGTALVGKVGVDQTTPGTTNAVAPISGQAGVAGGAGAVGATVQRVTLASDDPAVALLSRPTATARLPSAAASTNATNVKTSAGTVFRVAGKNNAAYDVFLVLYDAVTNPPVPATTTIRNKLCCPAGQAFAYDLVGGQTFGTGIGYAFTKLVADSDTTVLVAADITGFNLDYV